MLMSYWCSFIRLVTCGCALFLGLLLLCYLFFRVTLIGQFEAPPSLFIVWRFTPPLCFHPRVGRFYVDILLFLFLCTFYLCLLCYFQFVMSFVVSFYILWCFQWVSYLSVSRSAMHRTNLGLSLMASFMKIDPSDVQVVEFGFSLACCLAWYAKLLFFNVRSSLM